MLHTEKYVPHLAHNFLSVGQLIAGDYSILFDDYCYTVYDKKSTQSIFKISVTQNHMFLLEVSSVKNCYLIGKTSNTSLSHQRYEHLNVKGLKFLG